MAFRIWNLVIWRWMKTVSWRSVNCCSHLKCHPQSTKCELFCKQSFLFCTSIAPRFWTLVWHGTLMMRWPATWPRAGTVHQRSCWTGCITTWQVDFFFKLVWSPIACNSESEPVTVWTRCSSSNLTAPPITFIKLQWQKKAITKVNELNPMNYLIPIKEFVWEWWFLFWWKLC